MQVRSVIPYPSDVLKDKIVPFFYCGLFLSCPELLSALLFIYLFIKPITENTSSFLYAPKFNMVIAKLSLISRARSCG